MLNTTLRNGPMLLIWLCLIFSVRAEEVPFLAPQQRPQLEANQPWPADRFLVLAYHDVEDDAADQRYLSVRTSALNEQIAWLLHNGYHAISVQDILDAHYGLKSLPPKAFLLSFDDGYSSFTPAYGRCLKPGTSRRCGHRWAAGWTLPLVSPLILAA
nr:hypothetical protein [Klebsiella pneumoniae]